jgi:tetratricopeptide (TPR) repeat protein
LAARGKLDDAFARLAGCGADPELVALCRRCLGPDPVDRPANAGEVAKAVAGLRAAADERARQADLDRVRAEGDRAKAETEAREQRKRRRVQLALAGSIGLLLAVGSAAGWYVDHQAAQRRAERRHRADEDHERRARNGDALADLLTRAETALRDDDDDLAEAALAQIDRRLPEGGGEELAGRAERCRAGLKLLRELDAIDTFRWTPTGGKLPATADSVGRLRAALAGYGVEATAAATEPSAAGIDGSLVRDRLLAALDQWLVGEPSAGVRAVLRRADPDPYRDALRDAIVAKDGARQRALAQEPAAREQPPRFTAAVGHLPPVPVERRRELLEAALRQRPGDLTLLMTLGNSYSDDPAGLTGQVRWFQAAVAAHPRKIAGHHNLGAALAAQGDRVGAAGAYREAIKLDPKYAPTHNNLGMALRDGGDLAGAVAEFKEAIRADPTFAPAHNNLGLALRDGGDLAGAVAEYKEAIRLDPKFALARSNLGVALKDGGDLAGAVAEYKEAIRADPTFAPAHSNLGNALRARGDLAGAVAECREAIKLDPKDSQAHHSLGLALRARGDLPGAVAEFKEAIRLDPKHAPTHYGLGIALSDQGDVAGAVAEYREAIRLDPKYARAHNNLGNALRARGDLPGALAAYREATRLDPKEPRAHNNLGVALFEAGDPAGAAAAYKAALALDPTNGKGHFNLGIALSARGDLAGAVAEYQEAVRIEPKFAYGHHGLAWLLATGPDRVRDGKRAVEHATRSCELSGWNEPDFIDTLAAAHAAAGDFDKAVEYQEKALTFPAYEKSSGKAGRERLELYRQKKAYYDPAFFPREKGPPPRVVEPPTGPNSK